MEGKAAYITEYAVNMIYFTGQVLVVMDWVRYVVYRVYNKKLPEKVDLFGLVIPAVAIMVVIFTTPVTKLCFYVDSSNFYHRGSLCTVLALITMAYIIVASFIGLHRRSKEILSEKRRECLIISAFAIPPLIGGSAQVLTYGIALLWPTVVLSILMAFINMQNQAISQDALTGLNNRGNLDRYLHSVVDGSDRSVALIIADINNFKKINDSFGHVDLLHSLAGSIVDAFLFFTHFCQVFVQGDQFLLGGRVEEHQIGKNVLMHGNRRPDRKASSTLLLSHI